MKAIKERIKHLKDDYDREMKAGKTIKHIEEELVDLKSELAEWKIEEAEKAAEKEAKAKAKAEAEAEKAAADAKAKAEAEAEKAAADAKAEKAKK